MLNRTQWIFILGMNELGVPIIEENYKKILQVSYLAQERRIYISPKTIYYERKTGRIWSEKRRQHYDDFDEDLSGDVMDIQESPTEMLTVLGRNELPLKTRRKLGKLKRDIKKQGIEKLLAKN